MTITKGHITCEKCGSRWTKGHLCQTDIVERLRDDYEKTVDLCAEAADEIERLRTGTEIAAANGICPLCGETIADEIIRERERCAAINDGYQHNKI